MKILHYWTIYVIATVSVTSRSVKGKSTKNDEDVEENEINNNTGKRVNKLLRNVYRRATELGIIEGTDDTNDPITSVINGILLEGGDAEVSATTPPEEDSDEITTSSIDDNTTYDPITQALTEIIRGSLSEISNLTTSASTIIIENEIINNTYLFTEVDGVQFTPVIEVTNDMQGSLHGNNNAESESGDVQRQNGVADFEGALTNNNNAHSENGDVIRQNGVIAKEYIAGGSLSTERSDTLINSTSNVEETMMGNQSDGSSINNPSTSNTEEHKEGEEGVDDDSLRRLNDDTHIMISNNTNNEEMGDNHNDHSNTDEHTNNYEEEEEEQQQSVLYPENAIIIRNKIIGNSVTRTKQNGLIVTPKILFQNNMEDALHNNNNAKSSSGNVQRQNGVADFTNSLSQNNNASSKEGSVTRQNGIIGTASSDIAQMLTPEAIQVLLKGINDLETIEDLGLSAVVGEVVKVGGEGLDQLFDPAVITDTVNGVLNGLTLVNGNGGERKRRNLRGK